MLCGSGLSPDLGNITYTYIEKKMQEKLPTAEMQTTSVLTSLNKHSQKLNNFCKCTAIHLKLSNDGILK